MTKEVRCAIESRLFGVLDDGCRQVIAALREGRDTVELVRALGTTVEYAMCDALRGMAETAHHWVDGVDLAGVQVVAGTSLHAHGFAWCADDQTQWRVPVQIVIDLLDVPPLVERALTVWLGDADFYDLRSQPEWKPNRSRLPREWLYVLTLQPQGATGMSPGEVAALEGRLLEWATSNTARPIVGPDWQRLTLEQALAYIRDHSGLGHEHGPVVAETWLDGGPALRIHSRGDGAR